MTIKLTTPDTTKQFNSHKDLSEHLTQSLCYSCSKELIDDIPSGILIEMSHEEWIEEMITTACGAGWFVEELEE